MSEVHPVIINNHEAFQTPCECYECVGAKTDDSGYIENNLKYHTFLERCEQCGEPKTEYQDLGRKGYYRCWYCWKRYHE